MTHQVKVKEIINNINSRLIGKNEVAELSVITLLAGGHLLIEDIPGVGKTTLANLLARSVDLGFTRIQFTPDTLPGDVVGSSVFNMKKGEFEYVQGAIMNNIVLVDEINRTSPKTQSALLEAMQEGQVSVDGVTYPLKEPFMLIATQNPIEFIGTYNLPEAQLDRFLMKVSIGYPAFDDEKQMTRNYINNITLESVKPVIDAGTLIQMQRQVKSVKVSPEITEYIINIVTLTRENNHLALGASPRATLALAAASRSRAYISGRDYVIPDDVQAVMKNVLCHRLILTVEARVNNHTPEDIIEGIKKSAKIPF